MKRTLAFLLTFAMLIAMLPLGAFAAEKPTISLSTDAGDDLKIGDTFTVTASLADNTEGFASLTLSLLWNSSVVKFTGFDTVFNEDDEVYELTDTILGQTVIFEDSTAKVANSRTSDSKKNGTLFYANFEVVGYGKCEIALDQSSNTVFTFAKLDGADIEPNVVYETPYNLTISEPAAPAPDYEIYYTLSGSSLTDSADDAYTDYDIGDTVTAEIFLKNNTDTALKLQAYDIYLDYHAGLKYAGHSMNGAVALTDASGTDAAAGAAVTHIEAVGENFDAVDLGAKGEVSLGSVSFTVDKANANVKYDTALNIGFKLAADTENTAKAKNVTNFSIGSEATGDKKSYYPSLTGDVLGAEVMTKYTVSYDANGGENAPAEQIKYYNVPLDLTTDEPTCDGYAFLGWSTDNGDNSANALNPYTGNEDETFYAVWERSTFTVTWLDQDGTLIEKDENIASGTALKDIAPANPSKTADAEFTYTFAGWATSADQESGTMPENLGNLTGPVTYYAAYSKVTNTYTVTWKNYDGTVLETDENVAYGTTPEYNSATPVKPDSTDGQFSYTFNGWNPEVDAITGETEYTATFKEETKSYTVKFATENNGTLTNGEDQTILFGEKPTYPTATANPGYEFDGWYVNSTKIDPATYTISGEVTLTAQYKAEEYTITLDVNGGNALDKNTITYKITDTVTLPAATKTGATFDGWKLEFAVGSWAAKNHSAGDYTNQYGTITLVAQWTNKAYTITKGSVNGGTVEPNATSANYGDVITLTNEAEAGYEFVEYKVTTENGDPVTVTEGKFTMPAANVTVSATFKAIDYKVEVGTVSNGQVTVTDSEGINITTANVGDQIILQAAADTGYQWVSYTVTDSNGQPVTVTDGKFAMPAADVTITAEFTGIPYEIQYNNNGGSGTMNKSNAVYGTAIKLEANLFTKTGYHFAGWAITEDGTAEYQDLDEVINLSNDGTAVILYAVWEANTDTPYTVKHWQQNLNAGTEQNDTNYTLADTEEKTGVTDSQVEPAVKPYAGFTAPDVQKVTIAADGSTVVNYYYTRNTYKITYDPNGGSEIPEGSYVYGEGNNNLPTPTKPGYDFTGWVDGENNPVPNIKSDDLGDKNLIATWQIINYTITLDANGGNVTPSSISYTITDSVNLPVPTKEYYTFMGWKVTTADGNWAENAEIGASNLNVAGKYGNVTLTAQWNRSATFAVEQYKYALNGYWMLRVDATDVDEGKEYRFNDVPMFYMSKASDVNNSYLLDSVNDSGVFYTLISGDYVADGDLTEAGYDLLKIEACANGRSEIEYDGDINADGVVNIADANIVYQMVEQTSMGGYYTETQLDTLARLKADMDTAMTTGTNEYRGSIADVEKIVNIINGVTQ